MSYTSSILRQSVVGEGALDNEKEKKNLWRNLLQSVRKRSELNQAHILVLGDRGAGKRSLIRSMNRPFLKQLGIMVQVFDEIGSEYSLFESSYLYVRDFNEYAADGEGTVVQGEETLTRVNVWVVNDIDIAPILSKILKPEDLEYTLAVIVPDIEKPWEIMNHC